MSDVKKLSVVKIEFESPPNKPKVTLSDGSILIGLTSVECIKENVHSTDHFTFKGVLIDYEN